MACIAFIGDSNTATRVGNGIYQADTFSQKIGNQRGFTSVVNAGIGGNTTGMMLARFQADVLDAGPSHIVLSPGINDLGEAIAAGYQAPYMAAHEANIRAMVAMAKDACIPVTLMTPPLVRSTVYIENIAPYNDTIKRVAADCDLPVVDLYFEFMQVYFTTLNTSPGTFTSLYVDAQHVSAAGHSFIRDIIAKPSNWRAAKL